MPLTKGCGSVILIRLSCGYVGIGRQASLRCLCSIGHAGSSPATRTTPTPSERIRRGFLFPIPTTFPTIRNFSLTLPRSFSRPRGLYPAPTGFSPPKYHTKYHTPSHAKGSDSHKKAQPPGHPDPGGVLPLAAAQFTGRGRKSLRDDCSTFVRVCQSGTITQRILLVNGYPPSRR